MLISGIDTETTHMKGKVCEFGETIFRVTKDGTFKVVDSRGTMVNPQEPITFEAMAIHGVTEEDVKDAPSLERVLKEHSLEGKQYVFAHNLSYEKAVLPENYFPENARQLCTLKLARVLYSKEEVESHKLGVLYYQWGLYKDERLDEHSIHLHSAKSDTLVNGLVLEYMLRDHNLTLDQAWEMLYDPSTCKGGKKYPKGTRWEDIILKHNDYDYVEYTFNNVELAQEELDYLEGLLSQYESVKMEQYKICSKKKYLGKEWSVVVKEDLDYVNYLIRQGYLKGGELEYVEGLLSS